MDIDRPQVTPDIIESEKRYRSLFENMNAGFVLFEVLHDEQGAPVDLRILAANEGFAATTGLPVDEVRGARLTAVLPGIEEDDAGWISTYSRVAATGVPVQFEQGSELLGVYYSVSAYRPAPGECAVTFLDITERKRIEADLEVSETRFGRVFDSGASGMVIASRDFRFRRVNNAFCEMVGFTETELQQKTFAEITHPDDLADDFANVKKLLDGELDFYRTEKRYIRKDGSSFWVQLTVSAIHDSEGQFRYFVGIIIDVDDQKRAELAVRDSEERLRLATEQAGVAVWEYDFATNCMARSSNHDGLYGLEWQERWEIDTFLNATHPDDRDRSDAYIQASVAPGGPDDYAFDFRVVYPDGTIRWLAVTGRVTVRDAEGHGIKVRGTLSDITSRVEMDLALRAAHDQLATIVETTPGIVTSFRLEADGSTSVPFGGARLARHFGIPEAQLSEDAESFFALVYPDDLERLMAAIGESAKQLSPWRTEWRICHPVRGALWVEGYAMPRREPDGATAWYGVISDITDRKLAEESLRAYAQRLDNLHRIDQAILQATDSPAVIARDAIARLCQLLGCRCASVGVFDFETGRATVLAAVGDTDSAVQPGRVMPQEVFGDVDALKRNEPDIVVDGQTPEPATAISQAMHARGIHSMLNTPVVSHGELIGALNVGWSAGEAVSAQAQEMVREVADQISIAIEQARLLAETKRHAEELEATVRRRTAQLEAANKELEAFSYSVSHDLRAPLRHISGYLDMLKEQFPEELPEKAAHYMDVVTDASQQMGVLIDDLLEFSRTGRQELRQADLDMNGALREALDELDPDVDGREIAWTLADLPHVLGDRSLIKRVWVNLLGNAIKYTQYTDSAAIEVGFAEEPNSRVFYVRDNGAGFDMEYAHKLFGVFQRLHSPAQFPGTGIGLANVQRIIHKHGGRVWAEGKPDEGATFYFSLPNEPSDAGGN